MIIISFTFPKKSVEMKSEIFSRSPLCYRIQLCSGSPPMSKSLLSEANLETAEQDMERRLG